MERRIITGVKISEAFRRIENNFIDLYNFLIQGFGEAITSYISEHPQDLSNLVVKESGKSLLLNTEAAKIHTVHSDDQDLSVKANVGHTHAGVYESANSNIQNHVISAHAPSDAVNLATIKADTDIADAISKKHSNSLDHNHSNKSTLDTYTQTEVNLSDAVIKRHSNNFDHSNVFKAGIITRDITTTSGVINVAHGLGRMPVGVRVNAFLIQAANTTHCIGVSTGTTHSGLCTIYQEGTSSAITDTTYSSTAFELGFSASTVVNPYTGANRQTCTITFDATNIIFTWTKTGTLASTVANILWDTF
jgi:hypothetical protein